MSADNSDQQRNWIFTINNWNEEDVANLHLLIKTGEARYFLFGKELAPSTGTPHLQGYIQFEDGKRKKQVSKMLLSRASIRSAHGDYASNDEYCKADGDYTSAGIPKKTFALKKTKVEKLNPKEVLQVGSLRNLLAVREDLNTTGIKLAQAVFTFAERKRNWKPEVIWFCGASGQGKSRFSLLYATVKHGEDEIYKNVGTRWFDGYDAHECIILEEFRGYLPVATILTIFDRYECRLEVKGGFRQCLAQTIIVNSVAHPSKVFEKKDWPEVERRISRIITVENVPEEIWDATKLSTLDDYFLAPKKRSLQDIMQGEL